MTPAMMSPKHPRYTGTRDGGPRDLSMVFGPDPNDSYAARAVHTQGAWPPEKQLFAAVLQTAVEELRRDPIGDPHQYGDVRRWLEATDEAEAQWPCSLGGICAALDLDAAHLRATLRHELAEQEKRGRFGRVRQWAARQRSRFTAEDAAANGRCELAEAREVLSAMIEDGLVRLIPGARGWYDAVPADASTPAVVGPTGLTAALRLWIAQQGGEWTVEAAAAMVGGNRHKVGTTLSDLCRYGEIERVVKGVYRTARTANAAAVG